MAIPAAPTIYTSYYTVSPRRWRMCWLEVVEPQEFVEDEIGGDEHCKKCGSHVINCECPEEGNSQ